MHTEVCLIIVGFLLLIYGANWLVDGASSLAKRYHISDLVIGLTIVAFGTSAPELVVNSIASLQDKSDIVYGNVVGSNIFNTFLVLGIVGLILPITVQKSLVWKEIPISIGAAVLLLLLSNDLFVGGGSVLSRVDGIILLGFFCGFIYYIFNQLKDGPQEDGTDISTHPEKKIIVLIMAGLTGLIIGGKLVVDHSIIVAHQLGVSEKIIGLTIIAAGTSLPELVTSVVAAFKMKSDIAMGNVIGSNIFNILLIISVSAIMNPIPFNPSFNFDIGLLIVGSVFLFVAMFTGESRKLDRWEAGILLIGFIIYTFLQVSKEL